MLRKVEEMHRIKKKIINMYKIFKISAKTFVKNCVYNMINKEKNVAKNKGRRKIRC